MEKLQTMMVADNLATAQTAFLNGEESFNSDVIYQIIDELGVLNAPIASYFEMTQEQYDKTESDHKLTLLALTDKLSDLHDRILTNHVDGYVDQNQLNLTYNHENPYEDGRYNPEVDYHLVTYGLKVIGAVAAIDLSDLKAVLSKDALLSIGLASYALKHNA